MIPAYHAEPWRMSKGRGRGQAFQMKGAACAKAQKQEAHGKLREPQWKRKEWEGEGGGGSKGQESDCEGPQTSDQGIGSLPCRQGRVVGGSEATVRWSDFLFTRIAFTAVLKKNWT